MPEINIAELLSTPVGTIIAASFFLQAVALVGMAFAMIRRPGSNGQSNGNGKSVEVVGQLATNQHQIIMGLIEQFSNINTALRAHTITLEQLVKNDAQRDANREFNAIKIEQQSQNIDDLRSQQEKLGSYLVKTINKGEGREAAFSAMLRSVQDAQGATMSLLQDIRRRLPPPPTPPASAPPPDAPTLVNADAAQGDATVKTDEAA